jgi:hypothetical protein
MFQVNFKANGTEYRSKGETLFDAFLKIPLHFMNLKTKAVVEVKFGKKKKVEKLLTMLQGRMLLNNPLRRKGFVNLFEDLLKHA